MSVMNWRRLMSDMGASSPYQSVVAYSAFTLMTQPCDRAFPVIIQYIDDKSYVVWPKSLQVRDLGVAFGAPLRPAIFDRDGATLAPAEFV